MLHYNYVPNFLCSSDSDYLLNYLTTSIPWKQVIYKKSDRGLITTPRLTWCAGFHTYPFYSFSNIYPNPIPKNLLVLKKHIESFTNNKYNYMLFAKYRDGQDSISYHSDDERFLGDNPTIPLINIGSSRIFKLKNKHTKEVQAFNLSHGDLLVMQNNCQKDYMHSVPKTKKAQGTRYSITFRNALNESGSYNYYTYNVGS